jgi:hypothetical protein
MERNLETLAREDLGEQARPELIEAWIGAYMAHRATVAAQQRDTETTEHGNGVTPQQCNSAAT